MWSIAVIPKRPRKVPTESPAIGVAAPRTLLWDVRRAADEAFEVVVPKERGRYVLSLLKISDDGDVGSATATFEVK